MYIRRCISLIRYHMPIYTSQVWFIYLYFGCWKYSFFQLKLMAERISCFEITNFRVLNTFTIKSNISKKKVLIQIALCWNARIQIDISKNNHFSAEEAINYIPCTEKRKRYQYVKCVSSLGLYPPPCFQFYHGNWRY